MAEEAKDAEVLNSHVIEFEVDTLQVRHVSLPSFSLPSRKLILIFFFLGRR